MPRTSYDPAAERAALTRLFRARVHDDTAELHAAAIDVVTANLGGITLIARDQHRRYPQLDFDDLRQELIATAIAHLPRYDSTYRSEHGDASVLTWLRKGPLRAVGHELAARSCLMSVSGATKRLQIRIQTARQTFEADHGRYPTTDELLAILNADGSSRPVLRDRVEKVALLSPAAMPVDDDGEAADPTLWRRATELSVEAQVVGDLFADAARDEVRAAVAALHLDALGWDIVTDRLTVAPADRVSHAELADRHDVPDRIVRRAERSILLRLRLHLEPAAGPGQRIPPAGPWTCDGEQLALF